MITEIWCEDCQAQFRDQCHCPGTDVPIPDRRDRWVGIDGHAYIGEADRPSSAFHDTDNCRCPASPNFDPDSWY